MFTKSLEEVREKTTRSTWNSRTIGSSNLEPLEPREPLDPPQTSKTTEKTAFFGEHHFEGLKVCGSNGESIY